MSERQMEVSIRNYGGILCHVCVLRFPRLEFERHFLEIHFGSKEDFLYCGEHMVPLKTRSAVREHMPCMRKEERRDTSFECLSCGYRCVGEAHRHFHESLLHKTMHCSTCNVAIHDGYGGLVAHKKTCRRLTSDRLLRCGDEIGASPLEDKASNTAKKARVEGTPAHEADDVIPVEQQETPLYIIDEYVPPDEGEQTTGEAGTFAGPYRSLEPIQPVDDCGDTVSGGQIGLTRSEKNRGSPNTSALVEEPCEKLSRRHEDEQSK